ncbi:MAG: hypothetical protein MI724_11800, partial [Spirochaetales bacterium]|nr:hypothetical protein [Spirochaetales bacterium]
LRAHVVPFAGANRAPLEWYANNAVLLAVSHGNAPAVAERAVALMYAAAGRVVEFDRDLRVGRWHRRNDDVRPFDYWRSLTAARIAVLGAGAIGRRIAELVSPLARSVDPSIGRGEIVGFRRRSPVASDGGTEQGGRDLFDRVTSDLSTAVTNADVLFLALPLTDKTRGIVTRNLLARTDRAVLVNVGRAELIDEDDLYTALTDGTLSAAGLDVWYRSPTPFWREGPAAMPSTQAFHELANVVLSPHAASHCEAGKRGQLRGALAHLEEYLSTGGIAGAVDIERGY